MPGNNKRFGTVFTFGDSAKTATSNVFGSSTFGVSTPSAPISGNLFRSTMSTTGTGLFGQPTSFAFSVPASTSTGGFGFGATSTTGGLFGSTNPFTQSPGSLFGNNNTSAFGVPRPAFGGFSGSTPGTGLFGQATNTGTGPFGSFGGFTATAPAGTTIKFNPPTGTDTMLKGGVSTSIATKHQCITCMRDYENKSLEELRVEDYAANRKGKRTSAGMIFGGPTQPQHLFGSTPAFYFGDTTQTKPLFGGTTGQTSTFGSGGLFGQPAQTQNAGLFGKSVGFGAPATSAAPGFNFGVSAAAAAPVFNFGASSGTSLFDQTKPLFGQTTGLFGNTTTTQYTGFGTTTGFSGFGARTPQSTGLFGAKPTGFGTANTTTTNTFSFGNTKLSGRSLFERNPAESAFDTSTAFGTAVTGFGSFGTTPAMGSNLFCQNKPAASAFGSTGNVFGGGLGIGFGTSAFSTGLGKNTGIGLSGASTANKTPGFSFGNSRTNGCCFCAANPPTSTFCLDSTSVMPTSDPNVAAPQQSQQPGSPAPTEKMPIFDELKYEEPSLPTAVFLLKRSVEKLVLKDINNSLSSLTITSSFSPGQPTEIDVSISLKSSDPVSFKSSGEKVSPPTPLTVDVTDNGASQNVETSAVSSQTSSGSISRESISEPPVSTNLTISYNTSMEDSIAALHTNKQPASVKTYNVWSESSEPPADPDSSIKKVVTASGESRNATSTKTPHPTGIILIDPTYYTIPSLDDMIPMITQDQKCLVQNFTVGRYEFGRVTFPGLTNVFGLNLDEIVSFKKKEISVYSDDKKKPPVGEGLNRRAKVVLENVWPTEKNNHCRREDTDEIIKMDYRETMEQYTALIRATFIDYEPEMGTWIFEVDNFSNNYGLKDSDKEMDTSDEAGKTASGVGVQKRRGFSFVEDT